MKAVLLAAGLGTRLAPLTLSVPKILAPLGGRPLLAHQLEYLAGSGVSDVAINLHHHAAQVLEFLAEEEPPLTVRPFLEPELLGTAGALGPMRDFLDEPFAILYGDVVTDLDLGALLAAHESGGGIATLSYYRSSDVVGKGILEVDADGRVAGFIEKPAATGRVEAVNAGIYAASPEIVEFARPGADFGHDVWPAALAAAKRLHGFEIDCYLRDVGSLAALQAAERDLEAGAVRW